MAKLSELIERVEKATGPDPALDEAIQAWSQCATPEWQEYAKSTAYHRDGFWVSIGPIQPYTASIDAVVALVEKELPGAVWHIMTDYGGLRRAKIGPAGRPSASIYNHEDRPLFTEADAETAPLALLLAFLKSHEGKQ